MLFFFFFWNRKGDSDPTGYRFPGSAKEPKNFFLQIPTPFFFFSVPLFDRFQKKSEKEEI